MKDRIGPSFWDYFKEIGNSNIFPYCFCTPIKLAGYQWTVKHNWMHLYHNDEREMRYLEDVPGVYIIISIHKESGSVSLRKIFDINFDHNNMERVYNALTKILFMGKVNDLSDLDEILEDNLTGVSYGKQIVEFFKK